MEADARRYHGKALDELEWTDAQPQRRALAEYLAALETEAAEDDAPGDDGGSQSESTGQRRYECQPPKVI
jgi:hypothetical protein